MKKDGILLSRKHGVNPSVGQCFLCLEDCDVILFGQLKNDKEAPRKVCLGPQHRCSKCEELTKEGIVFISVDDAKSKDMQNPWRTGGWVVIKEEAVKRIVHPPELLKSILGARFAFVPDDAWDMLGLPR